MPHKVRKSTIKIIVQICFHHHDSFSVISFFSVAKNSFYSLGGLSEAKT